MTGIHIEFDLPFIAVSFILVGVFLVIGFLWGRHERRRRHRFANQRKRLKNGKFTTDEANER